MTHLRNGSFTATTVNYVTIYHYQQLLEITQKIAFSSLTNSKQLSDLFHYTICSAHKIYSHIYKFNSNFIRLLKV